MALLAPAGALLVLGTLIAGAVTADLIKVPVFRAVALHRLWRPTEPRVPG
jgi:hypothetical protein